MDTEYSRQQVDRRPLSLFARTQVDLVLTDFAMPQMNGHQLVNRLKQIAGHVPMILLGDPQAMAGQIHAADALLAKKNCSPQDLLERIKVMSARKRGPRKGALRHAPPQELAEASACTGQRQASVAWRSGRSHLETWRLRSRLESTTASSTSEASTQPSINPQSPLDDRARLSSYSPTCRVWRIHLAASGSRPLWIL